jgi:hypothetical protein
LIKLLYGLFFNCILIKSHWKFMYSLEVWYDKVLMMMTGNLYNAKIVVEALTIW